MLVTNDDGIDAAGVRVLAEEAVRAGLDVTVAAPGWDSSGASASFTAVEDHGGVRAVPWEDFGVAGVKAFAVEASPAYIVRAAIAGALGPVPAGVLSGINHGANLGHAVLHSGTVGAALTAATLGHPALAVSLANDEPTDWDGARRVLRQVIPSVLERPERVINLNIPDVAADAIRGIVQASLAPFGAVQVTNTEREGDRIKLTYSLDDAEDPEGSDGYLLTRDFATVTPLEVVCESTDPVSDVIGPLRIGSGGS